MLVAAAAAAGVLLAIDQIVLEHTLIAETLFTLLLAACLYAAVRTLDEPRDVAAPITTRILWIAAAGVALGLATWVRAVGLR